MVGRAWHARAARATQPHRKPSTARWQPHTLARFSKSRSYLASCAAVRLYISQSYAELTSCVSASDEELAAYEQQPRVPARDGPELAAIAA